MQSRPKFGYMNQAAFALRAFWSSEAFNGSDWSNQFGQPYTEMVDYAVGVLHSTAFESAGVFIFDVAWIMRWKIRIWAFEQISGRLSLAVTFLLFMEVQEGRPEGGGVSSSAAHLTAGYIWKHARRGQVRSMECVGTSTSYTWHLAYRYSWRSIRFYVPDLFTYPSAVMTAQGWVSDRQSILPSRPWKSVLNVAEYPVKNIHGWKK